MIEAYITFFHKYLIQCLSVFVTIIPLLLIWHRRAYIDPTFNLLMIYLIVKLLIDLLMFHYAATSRNNLLLYNINVPLRYDLLSGMFYYKLESNRYKKAILYTIFGLTIFCIWDIFVANPDISDLRNHQMVAYSTTLESALMLFWILIYFYETIQMLKISNILTYPFFWICSGLLLYYSSFIFIAPVLHYTEKWDTRVNIWFLDKVPYVFEIVCTILFSIGIWIFSARYYARQ